MAQNHRHNPGTRIAALSTDPPTGWVGGAVRHDAKAGWSVTTRHSRVEVVSADGYSVTAWLAARSGSLTPGAYRLHIEPSEDGAWPDATADRLEAVAIAMSASISFGSPRPRPDHLGDLASLADECRVRGKRWTYYVDRVRRGGVTSEPVERRDRPDYRKVAEVYLMARATGRNPRQSIVNKLGCRSAQLAGKWVQRSAADGWLTDPQGSATRGPRSAGRRLIEAWETEGEAPSWWSRE